MRLTIIPSDHIVYIDGVYKCPIDLSFMSGIHAVQWYDTWGEIERVDPETRCPSNERITSIEQFQPAIDAWNNWVPSESNPSP